VSFQRKALKLTWPEGHDLHGLEVLCRRPTIGQIEAAEQALGRDRDGASVAKMMRETIGSALIRWNYVDESGDAPPATPDGFAKIDIEAQMQILAAWQEKAIAVPADLGKEFGSGQPSPGATSGIPVTGRPGLSDALRNLPMLNEPLESSSASPATP
jgi:hypothetical protein